MTSTTTVPATSRHSAHLIIAHWVCNNLAIDGFVECRNGSYFAIDEGSADAVCSTEELAAEWKQHYERETGYKYRVIGVELRTEAPDAWFKRVHGQKAE